MESLREKERRFGDQFSRARVERVAERDRRTFGPPGMLATARKEAWMRRENVRIAEGARKHEAREAYARSIREAAEERREAERARARVRKEDEYLRSGGLGGRLSRAGRAALKFADEHLYAEERGRRRKAPRGHRHCPKTRGRRKVRFYARGKGVPSGAHPGFDVPRRETRER